VRGHHAGKVSGGAGANDKDAHAQAWRLANETLDSFGGSVGRRNGHLSGHAELLEDVERSLHDRSVRRRTHEDEDLDFHFS
jgi:hypothetical protein